MKILQVGKFIEHADGTWEIIGWSFDGNIPTEHADIEAFRQDCLKHAKEAGTYIRESGWRPAGWKNPYQAKWPTQQEYDAFEASADAMLKALKEKGAWMTPEQMKIDPCPGPQISLWVDSLYPRGQRCLRT